MFSETRAMTRNSLNVQHLGIDRRNDYGRLIMRVFSKSAIHFRSILSYSCVNCVVKSFDENEWQVKRKQPPPLLQSLRRRAEISGHRITSDSVDSRLIDFVSPQGVKQRLLDIPYVHTNAWRGSIPMRGHSGRAAAAWDTRGCISRSHA